MYGNWLRHAKAEKACFAVKIFFTILEPFFFSGEILMDSLHPGLAKGVEIGWLKLRGVLYCLMSGVQALLAHSPLPWRLFQALKKVTKEKPAKCVLEHAHRRIPQQDWII